MKKRIFENFKAKIFRSMNLIEKMGMNNQLTGNNSLKESIVVKKYLRRPNFINKSFSPYHTQKSQQSINVKRDFDYCLFIDGSSKTKRKFRFLENKRSSGNYEEDIDFFQLKFQKMCNEEVKLHSQNRIKIFVIIKVIYVT